MISYIPFWKTMKEKGATTHTLRMGGVSSSTYRRIKSNDSISTNTVDTLCRILDCGVEDIIRYVPDNKVDAV